MTDALKLRFLSFTAPVAFGVSTVAALGGQWSLAEFCWSTWLGALGFSWACVGVDSLRIVFSARELKGRWQEKVPALERVPDAGFVLALGAVTVFIACAVFYVYAFLFSFYGLFLSVFAEMEPRAFFGRNGFINSDFFSPVLWLMDKFWPMIAGMLIANLGLFLGARPGGLLLLPFKAGEIVKIHLMVLAMPFLCLLTWALYRDAYQPLTIVGLMALLYLLPAPGAETRPPSADARG